MSDSVTTIRSSAFYNCSGFTGNLVIPDNVTTIGYNAFSSLTGLDNIEIPNTVTTIDSGAFKNVKQIYYNGSATGSPWGALAVAATKPEG